MRDFITQNTLTFMAKDHQASCDAITLPRELQKPVRGATESHEKLRALYNVGLLP